MIYGSKCPKCGLMQLPGPTCKSCGTSLGASTPHPVSPQLKDPREITFPSMPAKPEGEKKPLSADKGTGQSHRFSFHGTGGTLFGIYVVNLLLTIITLGFYYFWGKVKVWGYLLGQAEFEKDRFTYHGTGKELFVGFLKALLIFGVPIALLNFGPELMQLGGSGRMVATFLVYGVVLLLIPFAMVGARRYRLSRTSWRGIRFSFRGQVWEFTKLFLGGFFLSVLTLGFYYPFFSTRQYGFMTANSYLGNQRFNFDGKGRELFGPYVLALVLTLPTLGLYWYWYLAKKQRFFWEHTTFGSARFRYTATGKALMNLHAGNMILLLLTVGMGWSWVVIRRVRFAFNYLFLEGALDLESIKQQAQAASATGESLTDLTGGGFDLG
jgi:uncharacterized membrane protein YjgN (DUF898 family)